MSTVSGGSVPAAGGGWERGGSGGSCDDAAPLPLVPG